MSTMTPTNNKAPREFWIPKNYECDFRSGIHVIEKSAHDKLQQELDAAKIEVFTLRQELDAARAEIDRLNNYTIKGYEEFFGEMKKQLADALAQIADYEKALEFYSKRFCDGDNGDTAEEVLNKWKG